MGALFMRQFAGDDGGRFSRCTLFSRSERKNFLGIVVRSLNEENGGRARICYFFFWQSASPSPSFLRSSRVPDLLDKLEENRLFDPGKSNAVFPEDVLPML